MMYSAIIKTALFSGWELFLLRWGYNQYIGSKEKERELIILSLFSLFFWFLIFFFLYSFFLFVFPFLLFFILLFFFLEFGFL